MQKVLLVLLVVLSFIAINCSKDEISGPSNNIPDNSAVINIAHNGIGGYTFGLHGADQIKRFQTFVAAPNHLNITGLDVKIRKNTPASTCCNVSVELYETANNMPTNLLAVSSINIDSLSGTMAVLHAPLKFSGLIAGNTYAIVLGQSNVQMQTNSGFEWCTANADTNLNFGKYNGSSWISEPSLGDGWLKVYVDNANRINKYSFESGSQVVFFDDFERPAGLIGNGWTNIYGQQNDSTYVDVYDDGGGNRSARVRKGSIFTNGDTTWTDYTFSAKVKTANIAAHIALRFHAKDASHIYDLELWGGDNIDLSRYVSGWTSLSWDSLSYSADTYYDLKIIARGNNIKVYFDNLITPIIDCNDPLPVANGRIGICLFDTYTVMFDDVLVTVP